MAERQQTDHTGHAVELEFGVPVPGSVVPEDRWSRTAIKRMPPPGVLDWGALFGRQAPVMLDIGCGNGRSTLISALSRPEVNHLASDILPVVVRYGTRRANQRGLTNVRFAVIGGRELLRDYVAAESVAEIHCYHPQPFYERRDIKKRLITPTFLELVFRSLVPGGMLVLQTDNPAYWKYMEQVVPALFDWQPHPQPWPESPQGRTRREILALREKLPVFRAVATRKTDLSQIEVGQIVADLPWPRFNADRRLARLDQLEREG